MTLPFIVIGSVNLDMVMFLESWPAPHSKKRATQTVIRQGGAAANVACILARMGHPVTIGAAIGMDEFGDRCAEEMRRCGVDLKYLQRVRAQTGVAVALECEGTKRIVTSGGANDQLDTRTLQTELEWLGRHLHWVANKSRDLSGLVDVARSHGCSLSCECNGEDPSRFGRGHSLLFMNSDEAKRLSGSEGDIDEFCAELAAILETTLVVTKGGLGAAAYSCEGKTEVVGRNSSLVRDRTGAGDAFVAGFLSRWSRTPNQRLCLSAGLDLAKSVVGALPRHSWLEILEEPST